MNIQAPHLRLVGGLAIDPVARRADLLTRMAADLLEDNAFRNKRDAMHCLLNQGYHTLDAVLLLADAMALAFQDVVAFEISQP